jgi:hypothetical protein
VHSPGQAILWQIFGRFRWGFVSAGVFLLAAVALSHVLPRHWTIPLGDDAVPAVGWFLGMSCLFVNVMLIVAFSMSGADARNFTFDKYPFVLPVRTAALVAWPLISGCLTVAAVWLINASFVFRPTGIAAPLWWPATALALFLATFQALAWTPFAQRWLHCVLAVVVLMTPFVVLLVGIVLDVRLSEFAVTVLLMALIPLAYFAAHSGVARARCGDFYDWRAWGRFTEWLSHGRRAASHPFRSMRRAQLWYECRAHMIVPVFIACMLPCFLFVVAIEPRNVDFGWRLLGILLVAPVLVAMLSGGALGHLVDPLSKHETGSFFARSPYFQPGDRARQARPGRDDDGGDLDALCGLHFVALSAAWLHAVDSNRREQRSQVDSYRLFDIGSLAARTIFVEEHGRIALDLSHGPQMGGNRE